MYIFYYPLEKLGKIPMSSKHKVERKLSEIGIEMKIILEGSI